MNHDEIHRLAARCLTQPAFLERAVALADAGDGESGRIAGSSHELLSEEAAASALFGRDELARLQLFNGFITKVKQGNVRRILPGTFRLLGNLNIELDFFVTFAKPYSDARARGPFSLETHLSLLEEQLHRYLQGRSENDRRLVRDVFVHEKSIWQTANCPQPEESDPPPGVSWRGCMLVQRYSNAVQRACQVLRELTFDRNSFSTEAVHLLAYWRDWQDAGVSSYEIDELTALIFGEVDGLRTVSEITHSLNTRGLTEITGADLEGFFKEAEVMGLVKLPESRSRAKLEFSHSHAGSAD